MILPQRKTHLCRFFPLCSLFDEFMRPQSPTSVATPALTLRYDQEADSLLAQLPHVASIMDSVTHVVCHPRVCGVNRDDMSSVKILHVSDTASTLIDGGSNVCATGDLKLYWTSPTSRQSTSRLHLTGYPHPSMTRSPNEGSSRLPSPMAPRTIKLASTVPTWLKPLYPRPPFLLQVTSSIIGIKKVARTPQYQVASDSPVATASSPCILIFSTETASTTAPRTSTLWIMTPSASLVTVRKPHLRLPAYLALNLSPPRRLGKSNLRFGCFGMVPRAKANLTYYHPMLLARHRSSNIIPFDQSTSRSRPTSGNRLLTVPPNVSLVVVRSFSWTSPSCGLPQRITNAQTRIQIVLSHHTMVIRHISLLLMVHPAGSGRSLQGPKNHPLISCVHL